MRTNDGLCDYEFKDHAKYCRYFLNVSNNRCKCHRKCALCHVGRGPGTVYLYPDLHAAHLEERRRRNLNGDTDYYPDENGKNGNGKRKRGTPTHPRHLKKRQKITEIADKKQADLEEAKRLLDGTEGGEE